MQLDFLGRHDPVLCERFYGTEACDKLPRNPRKDVAVGYIVNTDPHDKPGRHWIALWTSGQTCEVMDSYALPLSVYDTTELLRDWLEKHWKYVVMNTRSLQSLYSQSCGDYALMYLRDRARGRFMRDFVDRFSKHDYVHNDHKVSQMLKKLITKEIAAEEWHSISQKQSHQRTCEGGLRHLLL